MTATTSQHIDIPALAAKFDLKPQTANGKTEWHGANPFEIGATKDGFILYPEGNAFDRSTGTKYKRGEVLKRAGLDDAASIKTPKPKKPAFNWDTATKFDYYDETGTLVYQVGRLDFPDGSKDFRQRRPSSTGGWIHNLNDVPRVLFNLPDVMNANNIIFCEGEKTATAWNEDLRAANLYGPTVATTTAQGAGNTLKTDLSPLHGKAVAISPDNNAQGGKQRDDVLNAIGERAKCKVIELPDRGDGGDYVDFRAAGGTLEAALEMIEAAPKRAPMPKPPSENETRRLFREKSRQISEPLTLTEVLGRFKNWLYLEDTGHIEIQLATVAANLAPGDPVWPMIVGASGGGKTEPMNAFAGLPLMHLVSTVTESALLSGTPKKDKASDATGGLLRQIGPFGFILIKDFTSMLSQRRDQSATTLSALREVFDGNWTRAVGSDGARQLTWKGKCAVIAACTDTIDSHTAVIGTMGERFVFYRLKQVDDERALSRHALKTTGKEVQMRADLSRAVAGLFAGLNIPDELPEISDEITEHIIDLATLTVKCRSAVERDNHTREITLKLSSEAPTRLAKILLQLFHGLQLIGVSNERTWELLEKVALDSINKVRRATLDLLRDNRTETTSKIALAIGYPTQTARRALEELHTHGVLECIKGGQGKSDSYCLSEWGNRTFAQLNKHPISPLKISDKGCQEANQTPLADTFPVFQTDDISSLSIDNVLGLHSSGESKEGGDRYMSSEKRERLESAGVDEI